MNDILIALCVAVAVGGCFCAVFFQNISLERRAERRLAAIKAPISQTRLRGSSASPQPGIVRNFNETGRYSSIVRRLYIGHRLEQAGFSVSPRLFSILCLGAGIVLGLATWIWTQNIVSALLAFGTGGVLLPVRVLKFMRARRVARFMNQLPIALDTIVRGTRVGMPLSDCIGLIARDSEEPIASEFRRVVESQMLSFTVTEAILRMAERIPGSETEFFASVVAIQQRTGGNLSDALHNLSKLLRDRKQLRAKINAVSKEAKASAGIIGSLPLFVMGIISLVDPAYMAPLFETNNGLFILAGCGMWMATGVFVMRAMINFEI